MTQEEIGAILQKNGLSDISNEWPVLKGKKEDKDESSLYWNGTSTPIVILKNLGSVTK